MKKLIYLLIVSLVMLFSCSKDMLTDENPDLKRANVPIPLKGEMCMTENLDFPPLHVEGTPIGPIPDLYLPGVAWLSGHTTHRGKFQDQSSMKGLSAYLDMESFQEGKIVLVAVYEVTIVSAIGDYSYIVSTVNIDATDPEQRKVTGKWTLNGGTGKFENVTGSGTLCGILPCWEIDGTLEYPE